MVESLHIVWGFAKGYTFSFILWTFLVFIFAYFVYVFYDFLNMSKVKEETIEEGKENAKQIINEAKKKAKEIEREINLYKAQVIDNIEKYHKEKIDKWKINLNYQKQKIKQLNDKLAQIEIHAKKILGAKEINEKYIKQQAKKILKIIKNKN